MKKGRLIYRDFQSFLWSDWMTHPIVAENLPRTPRKPTPPQCQAALLLSKYHASLSATVSVLAYQGPSTPSLARSDIQPSTYPRGGLRSVLDFMTTTCSCCPREHDRRRVQGLQAALVKASDLYPAAVIVALDAPAPSASWLAILTNFSDPSLVQYGE